MEDTWIDLQKRTKTQEPKQSEEVKKNRQMIQIFIKVNGLKEFLPNASVTDKVSEIVRRNPKNAFCSRQDMYVTC